MRRLAFVVIALALLLAIGWVAVRSLLGSDLVRISLEQQLAAYTGRPVRIGTARVEVVPRVTLALGDVLIGEPPEVRLGTVRIVTGLRPLFSRTIDDAEIVVADSELPFPPPLPLMNAAPRPTGDASAPVFTIRSIRRFALHDVSVVAGDSRVDVDLESAVGDDRLEIASLVLRTPRTRLEASGALTSISRMEGRLDARADPLDVSELAAIAASTRGPAAPATRRAAPPAPLRIAIELSAPSAIFGAYAVTDVRTTIQVSSDRVDLDPISLGVAGGGFKGRMELTMAAHPPSLRLAGELQGLDILELLKHSGATGGITGRLSGSVALSASAAEMGTLLQSARGIVRATIAEGTLPGIDFVRPIVLAFGRPSGVPPEGSGSSFSRLGGTFTLSTGRLSSNDLALTSRDLDAAGRGTLNLISGTIEATFDLVLSKELSQQAGTDLVRYTHEDGRVTVPATVSGTLQRATISLDLAAAARRAIGNELRRRTKSLLDDLFGTPRQP